MRSNVEILNHINAKMNYFMTQINNIAKEQEKGISNPEKADVLKHIREDNGAEVMTLESLIRFIESDENTSVCCICLKEIKDHFTPDRKFYCDSCFQKI